MTLSDDSEGLLSGFGGGKGEFPAKKMLRGIKSLFSWPRFGPSSSGSDAGKPLRPTAYLDGLRGFAAFLVYWHHNILWSHAASGQYAIFENAWGWDKRYHFATLPFIRNFFSGGHMAVAMFYVISGYVLAVKPLSLIDAGEHLKCADNVGSALFRRWFRLYLPIIITTFVYMTSWHALGLWTTHNEPEATYGAEVWKWYVELKNFSFLFKEGAPWISVNTHLWSIALEMRGSIMIYCAILGLMRATAKARLLCQVGLIFYFLYICDGYYGALFISGMLQADLDLLSRKPDGYFPSFLRQLERHKTTIYHGLFVVGMLLAGVPTFSQKVEDLRKSPGWYYLSYLKPQAVRDYKWFFLFFAANMIVACIPRLPWLRRFFESRFCQYLGHISYALYLVHGPLLETLGDRVYFMVGFVRLAERDMLHIGKYANLFPLSKAGPLGLEIAFLVPHLLLLPINLYVADLVTRFVDEPSVKFASAFYKKTLGGQEEKQVDVMRLA